MKTCQVDRRRSPETGDGQQERYRREGGIGRDAWLLASVEGDSPQVDPGHLLSAWLRSPERYGNARVPALDSLDPDVAFERAEALREPRSAA